MPNLSWWQKIQMTERRLLILKGVCLIIAIVVMIISSPFAIGKWVFSLIMRPIEWAYNEIGKTIDACDDARKLWYGKPKQEKKGAAS